MSIEVSIVAESSPPGPLELQDPANGVLFFVEKGGLDDHPVVRGKNVTIPAKAGQTWMPKVDDHLLVTLHGYVEGQGATIAAQRLDYRALMDAIRAVFDPTAAPVEIAVHGGEPFHNEGLGEGEVATIEVEFLRFTGPAGNGLVREFDIECRCVSDPVAWTIEESS